MIFSWSIPNRLKQYYLHWEKLFCNRMLLFPVFSNMECLSFVIKETILFLFCFFDSVLPMRRAKNRIIHSSGYKQDGNYTFALLSTSMSNRKPSLAHTKWASCLYQKGSLRFFLFHSGKELSSNFNPSPRPLQCRHETPTVLSSDWPRLDSTILFLFIKHNFQNAEMW